MKKIAVIGSVNMDLTAAADRHPGKGETVSGRDLQYIPGGKGANQAVAAARLGAEVAMFGCVGEDVFGDRLVENLRQEGVDTSHISRISGVSSGIAMITVAEGDNSIVVIPGANGYVTPAYLENSRDAILEADILVLQNEIPLESVYYAVCMGENAGKTILYNPAPAVPSALAAESFMDKISYITPNEHEASLLFPEGRGLASLLEKYHGRLVVTLGAGGAAAWAEGRMLRAAARPARVVDTTGAGDAFNGAFAFALANDYSMERALRFANTAASLSTEEYGAQKGMPCYEAVAEEM